MPVQAAFSHICWYTHVGMYTPGHVEDRGFVLLLGQETERGFLLRVAGTKRQRAADFLVCYVFFTKSSKSYR
jgi:hypothetical protein